MVETETRRRGRGTGWIVFAGILMSMNIYFMATNLFATLMILTLLMGGIGLIARAVRPMR